jgi:hypothetical protein
MEDFVTKKNANHEDFLVRENPSNKELVEIVLKLDLPKSLLNFISWYCCFANIEPSKFIYSLILHSLTELVYKTEFEDYSDVFKNLGVR